ncbi:MAG: NAD-dependent epimerase/dehydratase family protein [Lysobacter sp.]
MSPNHESDNASVPRYRRVLLTGAAGHLGGVLRERLKRHADIVRVSDIVELDATDAQEEAVRCDLADADAVHGLLSEVDAVVHLGGVSVERPFEEILPANIVGTYHLYEAARKHGVKRIVFASSNHVIGFYRQGEVIDADSPLRPDGYYGVSKAFGENLSRFYFDRYGIETVCLRIGSSLAEPKDRRMLVTWLGYDDLEHLVERSLYAPNVGHAIVYGASANRDHWWNNDRAERVGFDPQQSSEQFRAKVESVAPLAPDDPAAIFQGGVFVKAGPFE